MSDNHVPRKCPLCDKQCNYHKEHLLRDPSVEIECSLCGGLTTIAHWNEHNPEAAKG